MGQSDPGSLSSSAPGLPDVERARAYAVARLERELSSELCYHSIDHTCDDVVPACERFAAAEGVSGADLALLRTAAYFHDLGFVEQREDHELIGARIAGEVLPGLGYRAAEIAQIAGMIMATRLPQSPQTLLERILADADLDVLGRGDFLVKNHNLRLEMAYFGLPASDAEWYRVQLQFLRAHRYWTPAAGALRDEQKQRNIAAMAQLLVVSLDGSR